jgi:alcohol dehydrogenase
MKAAVLRALGTPLSIETVPDPVAGSGEVVVDVAAARVLAYANEVLSGARPYPVELPMIPGAGAIGRVVTLGPDATKLAIGDWVFCDPTVHARDDALAPDIILQGLIAPGPGPMKLHRHVHDGSWAERVRVPTENVTRIGAITAVDAARWCLLGTFLVPFGGLLAIGVRAGESVLVSGATGSFGAAGVAVALAMGAAAVVATGRNEATLADLRRRFGDRVRCANVTGDEEADRQRMQAQGPAGIDCVLDILPPAASPAQARAAVMAVRPGGRVALMGGIGMQGGGLELPYGWIMRNNVTIRGQWMYPREAVGQMVGLVRSGLIDLSHYEIAEFALEQANEAVAHAAANAGPFRQTMIRPGLRRPSREPGP